MMADIPKRNEPSEPGAEKKARTNVRASRTSRNSQGSKANEMDNYLQLFLDNLEKGLTQIASPVQRFIDQGRDKWLLLYFHIALEVDTPILEALFHSGVPFAPNRWNRRSHLQGKDVVFFFGCEPEVRQYLAGGLFEICEGFSDSGYAPGFGVAGEVTERLVPIYPPELVQHLSEPTEAPPFSCLHSASGKEVFVDVPRLSSDGATTRHSASSAAAAVVFQEALRLCRTARFAVAAPTSDQTRSDIKSLFGWETFSPHSIPISSTAW